MLRCFRFIAVRKGEHCGSELDGQGTDGWLWGRVSTWHRRAAGTTHIPTLGLRGRCVRGGVKVGCAEGAGGEVGKHHQVHCRWALCLWGTEVRGNRPSYRASTWPWRTAAGGSQHHPHPYTDWRQRWMFTQCFVMTVTSATSTICALVASRAYM